jgi:flagellin-specific chaperone FliS
VNLHNAYRRPEPSTGWTRIDLLLALYDGAIERLDRAEAALRGGDHPGAIALLARVQLIVAELASGVRLEPNADMGANMLRLYEFVTNELREAGGGRIANARRVLQTLREGFQAIRSEAADLERSGRLAAAERIQMVHATV